VHFAPGLRACADFRRTWCDHPGAWSIRAIAGFAWLGDYSGIPEGTTRMKKNLIALVAGLSEP
jgi:hypothetical protein